MADNTQGQNHGNDNHDDKDKKDKHLRNLAMDYGWAMSVFEEFPELMGVFKEAVKNNWSVARFQAEVQDTNWFKKHSDTWRTNTYLKLTDPKTYDERVNKVERGLADAAGSLGIDLGSKQLKEMSEQAFLHGWDETKINNVLARMVKITGKHEVGGDLAAIQDRLNAFAFANGVTITRGTMQKWLRGVVRGTGTEQEFQNYIQRMASAKFPNWAKEIKAGMTVAELAEPYRQTMAELLEINPNEISMNDRTLRRAMSFKNEKGEWDSVAIGDFEDMLRKDKRWQYTDNAREQVSAIAGGLLKMFGLVAE